VGLVQPRHAAVHPLLVGFGTTRAHLTCYQPRTEPPVFDWQSTEKPYLMELPFILVLFGAVALTLVVPAIRGMFR
jgi:hypothetical protein